MSTNTSAITQMLTNSQNASLNRSKSISTKVISSTPGRLRLRVARSHRGSKEINRIVNALQNNPNVHQVRTNMQNGSITIVHHGNIGSLKNVVDSLKDLGIIFGSVAMGKSEAASGVSNAVVDLNQRVEKLTNNVVDLRFLFPLGLAILAARQLAVRGLQFEIIPWYVLAWYAFDSFLKLHATAPSEASE